MMPSNSDSILELKHLMEGDKQIEEFKTAELDFDQMPNSFNMVGDGTSEIGQQNNAKGKTIFNKQSAQWGKQHSNKKGKGNKNQTKLSAQQVSFVQIIFRLNAFESGIKNQEIGDLRSQKEWNLKSQKIQEKKAKKIIKHMFKHHLVSENNSDFRLAILKIYFTIAVLKNYYLAHFQLLNFIQYSASDNLIIRNQKLIHQKLFESLLQNKTSAQEELITHMSLQKMIELNQRLAEFEIKIDYVTDCISKFWSTLLQNKETPQIYTRGLQISDGIIDLQKLYLQIDGGQGENKEIKIYYMMSAFYKYVVFKNDEHLLESQKSRHAQQTRKLAQDYYTFSSEKGLLMADLDLKKPMEITFINRQGAKMLGYTQNEMSSMRINQIMPQLIGENHHRFIVNFMSSGRHGMINNKMESFVKGKSGHIIPVFSFLSFNHFDLNKMILLIENNERFNPFDDKEDQNPFSICLADQNLAIYEMQQSLKLVCGISQFSIQNFMIMNSRRPTLEDIFDFENKHASIQTYRQRGQSEFSALIKQEILQNIEQDNEYEEEIDNREEKKYEIDEKGAKIQTFKRVNNSKKSNEHLIIMAFANSNYLIKILPFQFMQGKFTVNVIGIQRFSSGVGYSQLNQDTSFFMMIQNQNQQKMGIQSSMIMPHLNSVGYEQRSQDVNHGIVKIGEQSPSKMEHSHIMEGSFDLSSQTSTSTTGSSNSLVQKFSNYNSSLSDQKIPTTLKFVLQLIFIVIILVIATSTVTLILTQSNFTEAQQGILVSKLSLERLNSIAQCRVMIRIMFNIALGNALEKNAISEDRFTTYGLLIKRSLENLRQNQNRIDEYDNNVSKEMGLVKLFYLSSENQIEEQLRSDSQAVLMYVSYADDLATKALQEGRKILVTQNQYFTIENSDQIDYSATQIDRQGFFVLENGQQNLFQYLTEYTKKYSKLKISSIESKVNFQSTLSWICIAIIFLCAFVMIPLFGRIQNRILILMMIFFQVSKDKKKDMLLKISKFKSYLTANRAQTHLNSLNVNIDGQSINSTYQNGSRFNDETVKSQNQLKSLQQPKEEQKEELDQEENLKENFQKSKFNQQSKFNRMKMSSKKNMEIEMVENKNMGQKKEKNNNQEYGGEEEEDIEDENLKDAQQNKIKFNINHNDDNFQMISYFSGYVRHHKLKQSIGIIILAGFFSAYFLGTYFMSTDSFQDMIDSIEVLFVLYYRVSCVENTIYSVTETLVQNKNIFINEQKNEIMSFYQDFCYEMENDYQQIVRKNQPHFLSDAMSYINQLENGQVCDLFYGEILNQRDSNTFIDQAKCKSFDNGIVQTGLTNTFQRAYKTTQQISIEYANQVSKLEASVRHKGLSRQKVLSLFQGVPNMFDVQELILTRPLGKMMGLVLESIESNTGKHQLNFILVFTVFVAVSIVVLFIFLFSKTHNKIFMFIIGIFKKLKREMHLSNRLLYIIDFETATDEERNTINNFLTKY